MPDAFQRRLEFRKASRLRRLLDPAVRAFFDGTGVVLWPGMGTQRFGAFLSGELPRMTALVARVGAAPR